MAKRYTKFYYVKDKAFKEDNAKKSYAFAKKYATDNCYPLDKIYEVHSDSEVKFLEHLLSRDDVYEIKSHDKICLIGEFKNSNGDVIPNFMFDVSFTYVDKISNQAHVVVIVDSAYELTRDLILSKTLYDYNRRESNCYLEIYFYKGDELIKWNIGNNDYFKEKRKSDHQKLLAQRKVIRDQQRYDRLLELRRKGVITDSQKQELYRLDRELRKWLEH